MKSTYVHISCVQSLQEGLAIAAASTVMRVLAANVRSPTLSRSKGSASQRPRHFGSCSCETALRRNGRCEVQAAVVQLTPSDPVAADQQSQQGLPLRMFSRSWSSASLRPLLPAAMAGTPPV